MTALEAALSLGALSILLLLALAMVRRGYLSSPREGGDRRERDRDGAFPHACAVCGDTTLVTPAELHTLSSAEKALAVRERPGALGKHLVEYVCRRCDASHCFAVSEGALYLVGVNLYLGQHFSNRCAECRRILARPAWGPGEYDGRIAAAPGNRDGYGLRCRHCGAISCTACCTSATRNRTPDGSLLCPRCFRGPQDTYFHP